eukprot:4182268-Karenia_brevis.AAC.1
MSPSTGFVSKCGYDCGKYDPCTQISGRCEGHMLPSTISAMGSSIPWAFVTSNVLNQISYVTGICKVCMTILNVHVLHTTQPVCPTCEYADRPISHLVHFDPQMAMELESRQSASRGSKG